MEQRATAAEEQTRHHDRVPGPYDATQAVGHVDVDAFFAAVEQRDKPSLRGKPVVVGGVGPRGVVATASYEARQYGVHSAMPMAEARRRCPGAAVLAGRFEAYRESSAAVMDVLRWHSELVEPVSLDEAYVLLPRADVEGRTQALRRDIAHATGLTASVGLGATKLVAKIASDAAKPDGVLVVLTDEQRFLDGLPVRALPGLGPQTQARLQRLGVARVAQLRRLDAGELTSLLGESHGSLLWRLSRGADDRVVQPEHETKSISVEETFDTDVTDSALVDAVVSRMARAVAARLRAAGLSGRTVSLKARYPDFTTVTRSATHAGPADDDRTLVRVATTLVGELDLQRGVRLLGVGCSGLTPWVQGDLFEDTPPGEEAEPTSAPTGIAEPAATARSSRQSWAPGQDVTHDVHGRGWVWGAGAGRVTVRFETRSSDPGPIHTFAGIDPALHAAAPEPLSPPEPAGPRHHPGAGLPRLPHER